MFVSGAILLVLAGPARAEDAQSAEDNPLNIDTASSGLRYADASLPEPAAKKKKKRGFQLPTFTVRRPGERSARSASADDRAPTEWVPSGRDDVSSAISDLSLSDDMMIDIDLGDEPEDEPTVELNLSDNGPSVLEDPGAHRYQTLVRTELLDSWKPRRGMVLSDSSMYAQVVVKVDEAGELYNPVVLETTGNNDFHRSIQRAIKKTQLRAPTHAEQLAMDGGVMVEFHASDRVPERLRADGEADVLD